MTTPEPYTTDPSAAIDWIETLCENAYIQLHGHMSVGDSIRCCLGVAREVLAPQDNPPSLAPSLTKIHDPVYTLIPTERSSLGLTNNGVLKCAILNDGSAKTPSHTHPKIGLILAQFPEIFFHPAVAAGITEHFGWERESHT